VFDIHIEITLELARLQRAAFENVRQRSAAQQLGEAWVGLSTGNSDTAQSTDDPTCTPTF
jgi:hypothetical protein